MSHRGLTRGRLSTLFPKQQGPPAVMTEEVSSMTSNPEGDELLNAESKNKAKNEAKRAAKMEKFLAKQAKAEQFKAASTVASKPKTLGIAKDEIVVEETPFGEKKDMSRPMSASYDPRAVESGWYSWWEKSGFFKPECFGPIDDSREKFTIMMPPPNVTGSLHLGHATMLAIEDAIVRWYF